jgi:sulfite exporter TauE/SafE
MAVGSWGAAAVPAATLALAVVRTELQSKTHRVALLLLALAGRQARMERMQQQQHVSSRHLVLLQAVTTCKSRSVCVSMIYTGLTAGIVPPVLLQVVFAVFVEHTKLTGAGENTHLLLLS